MFQQSDIFVLYFKTIANMLVSFKCLQSKTERLSDPTRRVCEMYRFALNANKSRFLVRIGIVRRINNKNF